MNDLITWFNTNNGFAMVVLTFVYVVATALICYFNYKSAKATNDQTHESYKQFIENSRAHVVPKIIELEGEMLCLSFQNIGKDIATDVVIKVNESWLKKLKNTATFPETANKLRTIKKKKLFLTVEQQLCYGLCIPGNGYDDFKVLGETILKVDISYKTLGNFYEDHYEMPLDGYNFLVNSSDYVRLTKKQIQEMKNTNKELKKLNKVLNK